MIQRDKSSARENGYCSRGASDESTGQEHPGVDKEKQASTNKLTEGQYEQGKTVRELVPAVTLPRGAGAVGKLPLKL